MNIDEGILRAYLDEALPDDELNRIKKQLVNSPQAQATLAQLSREREKTAHHLESLAPSTQPSASQALTRFRTHALNGSHQSSNESLFDIKEGIYAMFIKRYKPAFITVALVIAVALLFSFAPVRTMAANFLTVFRVQQVKLVRVDMDHLENMKDNEELSGLLDQLDPHAEVVSGGGDPVEVDSLDEAVDLVDFPVAKIGAVPDNAGALNKIYVQEKAVYRLNLDKELIEAIFAAADIELSLPDSLNEEPIVVTKSASISQQWGTDEATTLRFAQLRNPEIDHPDDLDLGAFGVAVLQFLGKSEEEAAELGKTIDWANTLLLPVPSDEDVTATEVSINGAKGVIFTDNSDEAGVMWQNNGITYILSGNYSADQILGTAQSVN